MKNKNKRNNKQVDEAPIAIERVSPNYNNGLRNSEVQERVDKRWTNVSVKSTSQTIPQIIAENTFTYFNMIFLGLSILFISVGSFKNLSFLPIIIINTIIGIVQEIRAMKVLEKMSILNAPQTTVVRESQECIVRSDELVIDDIAVFNAGNQIPADAIVVNGEVKVNESLITGESTEIVKKQGDSLYSGSFVVSGNCHARLDKVGAESYISKITLEAKGINKDDQSEMIRSLNKLIKWVGIIIIPIGIILFVQSYHVNGNSFRDSIVSMGAAVIGMIPEGLFLLTTMALVISTMRLVKQKVLLHDMKSIETLSRVNVLCVDKTGTITENRMTVQKVVNASKKKNLISSDEDLNRLIGDFCNEMSNDNITMEAMKDFFKETTGRKSKSSTSFSSAVKYSSVTFEEGAFVLGAPEILLKNTFAKYSEIVDKSSSEGFRVLVFGLYNGSIDGEVLESDIEPLGFVMLANPLRADAKETFEYFESQDVEIKVISGDNPITVSRVAIEANIKGAEKFIDVSSLKDEAALKDALERYTVFGRVTPEQKKQMVILLRKLGNTVAMTGDGVNDILAMKEADCSIAMASGSDAATQAAQVVLLESNFSSMPHVVAEGRRVVNNIERSASLFLVKNIFSVLLSLFAIFFSIKYPFEPSHLALISMFTIGIPSFLLALESNENRIEGNFLPNVFLKALPGGLTDMAIVASFMICGIVFNLPEKEMATVSTMLVSIIGFFVLYKISAPLNKYRTFVLIANIIMLVVAGFFMNRLFSITSISAMLVLLLFVFSFAAESLFRLLTEIFVRVSQWVKK